MGERRKVEDNDALERDMHSNAVVNRDSTAFEKARAVKKKIIRERQEKEQLKRSVQSLENRMSRIEQMLEKALGEENND